ncbi:15518_t:CDS:2, partial [Dentiscutata erythropus]
SNEQLRWFATKLPSSVRHLEIRYWSICAQDLEDMLSICGRNLHYIAWGFTDVKVVGDQKYFSHVISEFCKKESRKIKRIGSPQFSCFSEDNHQNNGTVQKDLCHWEQKKMTITIAHFISDSLPVAIEKNSTILVNLYGTTYGRHGYGFKDLIKQRLI